MRLAELVVLELLGLLELRVVRDPNYRSKMSYHSALAEKMIRSPPAPPLALLPRPSLLDLAIPSSRPPRLLVPESHLLQSWL